MDCETRCFMDDCCDETCDQLGKGCPPGCDTEAGCPEFCEECSE